ncbi:MAG: hypothetical protein AB1689_15220 [Thermodesulfobacteriota bacterium]
MQDHDEVCRVSDVENESGCAVDWSWLEGWTVESAASDLQHLRIRFTNGETLLVQAALWQGKPFLAFKPHAAPARAAREGPTS